MSQVIPGTHRHLGQSVAILDNPQSIDPHLGASPDGLVSCLCCGLGVLEIMCLFSVRHTVPTCAAYFEVKPEGVQLSRKHDYYFQV